MLSRNYLVYLITNKITGKQYVGITKDTLKKRLYFHLKTDGCTLLHRALIKYGKEAFTMEIIWQAFTEDAMVDQENYFIQLYKTLAPNGYNLREGGRYGKFSELTKQDMTKKLIERWKNPTDKMVAAIQVLKDNPRHLPEPVIGLNIYNKSILRFHSITQAKLAGFAIDKNLRRDCIHCNDYLWFYDDGFSDQFYIDLADCQLGGFDTYRKNGEFWDNSEHKASRIDKMIDAAKDRARHLIAVSRFDGSILEFPSINAAVKQGYTWGSVRQALIGECKHAYNFCWFYKDEVQEPIKAALSILGSFNDTNIRPIKAINEKTNEELCFDRLELVADAGFGTKEVRQVLTGRRKTYKGFVWTFVHPKDTVKE